MSGKNSLVLLLMSKSSFLLIFLCLNILTTQANIADKQHIFEKETKAIQLSAVWKLEAIKESIALFEKTAEDWKAINEPRKAAFCLNEEAKLTQIVSDYETAFKVLSKAIKLETNNNLDDEKIISLSLFSLISRQKGNSEDFKKYSEKAIALSRNLNSPTAKAYALYSVGMYSYYNGNIKDAISFFEQANVFAQQTQDIQLISQVLFYIGFSYIREGNPFKSVEIMESALQKCEQYNYQRGKALSYFGIAFVKYLLNEKQKALDFYKQAEILFPDNFEWLERARIVNGIGVIYEEYGEFELAEINRLHALEYYQKADYPFGQLATLTGLAEINLSNNQPKKAGQFYKESLILAKRLDDKFHLAIIKEGMGNLEFLKANYDDAIKQYLNALQTYKNIGIKLPNIENLLGKAYEKKGDYKTARNYFHSASSVNQETKDFVQLSENLFNLAKLDSQQNTLDSSVEEITKSLEITESLYADVANSNLKRTYFSSIFDRYELYINLLMKMHERFPEQGFDVQALQASEKSRARSLLETLSLAEADLTKNADPEMVRREKEISGLLNVKADKLTELLSGAAEKTEVDNLNGEIDELTNELEEIKGKLKVNNPLYSALKTAAAFDVNEFQRNYLDDKTLLLEFSLGAEKSYLWLVSRDKIKCVALPARSEIEPSVTKLLELLKAREMRPAEEIEKYQERLKNAEAEYTAEAQKLSNNLFGQVAGDFGNNRLIIVPDGKLHYFPLAALPLPNSAELTPLLQTNEVVYEPSAAALRLLNENQNTEKLPTKDLLVFADPVFSAQDARLTEEKINSAHDGGGLFDSVAGLVEEKLASFRQGDSLKNLARLPATQEEAENIARIFGASQATIVSGFAARRERVLQADVADYKIIHFATHGLLNEEHPEFSGIVLSLVDENKQAEEGFLRLQDIYRLRLAANLVVLSACNSGNGKDIRGEGLIGLTTGFMQAGAKSVLSSLWKVDDAATAELMKNFYQSLETENLPPSAALREAQLKMMQNPRFKSPFYWAAFAVQGEFRQPLNNSNLPKNFVYYCGFGILAIFLVIGYGVYKYLL